MAKNINKLNDFFIFVIYGILSVVAVQVLIATPLLSWRLMFGGPVWLEWSIGIAVATAILVTLFMLRQPLVRGLDRTATVVLRPSTTAWLCFVLGVGVVLRLLWVGIYPAMPASDGATYLRLAEKLSRGEPYGGTGWRAYWPPGYPFLLTPLVSLFGASRSMIIGLNLFLFVATLFVVYSLGRALGGELTGRLAAAILSVWPNHIAMTAVPAKEYAFIFIVAIGFMLLYARPNPPHWRICLAGAFLGFGCLIQPGLILLPTAFVISDLLSGRTLRTTSIRVVLVVVSMLLVIAPWTIRNYQVFDQFVLISTNGGDVFYRANNAFATGGWIPNPGEVDFSGYSELEVSALGYELGKQWIRENPVSFLQLAIEKQILFLGDDSYGVYESLRRGGLDVSEPIYAIWKGLANAYWILLWAMILLSAWRWAMNRDSQPLLLLPMTLAFLYFYSLHSIVESGGKYHLSVLGLLAIIAASAVTASVGQGDRPDRELTERS